MRENFKMYILIQENIHKNKPIKLTYEIIYISPSIHIKYKFTWLLKFFYIYYPSPRMSIQIGCKLN